MGPLVLLFCLRVELTSGVVLPVLELVFQPETGFDSLDRQGTGTAIAGEDVMADATCATPFKVPAGFAKDMGGTFRASIGFIVDQEGLGSVIRVLLNKEARARRADEGRGAHAAVENLRTFWPPLAGCRLTRTAQSYCSGQFPQGAEQGGHDIGAIGIHFGAEHCLDGINVDECRAVGLQIVCEEREIRQGEGVGLVLRGLALVDKGDVCQVRPTLFEAGMIDRTWNPPWRPSRHARGHRASASSSRPGRAWDSPD